MRKQNKAEIGLCLLVLCSMWLAGNPTVMLYSSKIFTFGKMALGLTAIIIWLTCYGPYMYVSRKKLFVAMYLLVILLCSFLGNKDFANITTYLSYAMYILVGYLLSESFSLVSFNSAYIKIILLIAAVSIVCFLISLIAPEFIYRILPCKIVVNSSNSYVSSLFYSAIQSTYLPGIVLIHRNCGIFWEPGVYQVFLNIGIILLLDKELEKYDIIKFYILLIALITTFSMTGFIVISIVLLVYRKRVLKFCPYCIQIVLLLLGIVLCVRLNLFNSIVSQLQGRLDYGILNRVSMTGISIDDLLGWFGFGSGELSKAGYNSWINLLNHFGIVFLITILVGIICYCKYSSQKYIVFGVVIITVLLSEPIIMNIFFIWITLYGFGKEKAV